MLGKADRGLARSRGRFRAYGYYTILQSTPDIVLSLSSLPCIWIEVS